MSVTAFIVASIMVFLIAYDVYVVYAGHQTVSQVLRDYGLGWVSLWARSCGGNRHERRSCRFNPPPEQVYVQGAGH